jgi:aspartate ammonia-lyase
MVKTKFRKERDVLGELLVPDNAYYGIHTLRAIYNFPVSGQKSSFQMIRAIAMVKWAAAEANMKCRELDPGIGKRIQQAATEVISGRFNEQFMVDVFQAGAGTSFNMNANEVIANRAIELLGGKKGDYRMVHPNDHLNMSQSTNDVFPTSMRIASLILFRKLRESLFHLEKDLLAKATEFDGVIKSGRTHLQDAVPIRLGQEFSGYAEAIKRSRLRIEFATRGLTEIGLGGSAVGTGVNTHKRYHKEAVLALKKISGLQLFCSSNLIERMQSMADFVELSGSLRELAVELIRIVNDIRLLSSGPRTGLSEINLPAVQAGSSIMPGKVNPVMAEVTNMVAFQVMGNDVTIALAAQAGQLELNVMMPVIASNLLLSIEILANVIELFSLRCVQGITANEERCRKYAEESIGLVTILNPIIGYEAAAAVSKDAIRSGKSPKEVIIEKGILSPDQVNQLLNPGQMTRPLATSSVKRKNNRTRRQKRNLS